MQPDLQPAGRGRRLRPRVATSGRAVPRPSRRPGGTLPARGPLVAFALAATALAVVALVTVRDTAPVAGQPPISMTCPHHPDVIETSPGTCPFCQMALVPVRLDRAWTCLVHPATIAEERGTCPICSRQLVPVTVSLTWRCPGSIEEHLEPGRCADGTAMTLARTVRPHGDHNPRHGGQFFMAADKWHHIEGAVPAEQAFRLYVYDDYSRPLPLEELERVRGRVVAEEDFDPETRTTTDLVAFPLAVGADGTYLEARLDAVVLPAELTAKIRFAPGLDEERFDFTFTKPSLDTSPEATAARAAASETVTPVPPAPAAPEAVVASAPGVETAEPPAVEVSAPPSPIARVSAGTALRPATPTVLTAPEPEAAPAPVPEPDPALLAEPIAETIPGMLDQLRARNAQIGDLLERGDLTAVWFPAFQAKDVAIALESRLEELDPSGREATSAALQRLVRLAWLIDAHGDTGNRRNVTAAYEAFSTTVDEVIADAGGFPP